MARGKGKCQSQGGSQEVESWNKPRASYQMSRQKTPNLNKSKNHEHEIWAAGQELVVKVTRESSSDQKSGQSSLILVGRV